jgi:hypothetical protein
MPTVRILYTGPSETLEANMAQFKQATLANGDKTIVNMELICTMQRFPTNTTTIHFAADNAVQIMETPDDLLMSQELRNMRFSAA